MLYAKIYNRLMKVIDMSNEFFVLRSLDGVHKPYKREECIKIDINIPHEKHLLFKDLLYIICIPNEVSNIKIEIIQEMAINEMIANFNMYNVDELASLLLEIENLVFHDDFAKSIKNTMG